MKWQILMLTVEPRTESFVRIASKLSAQCAEFDGDVSLLVYRDNFETSMFDKRNALIQGAAAEYINFVDDDDDVNDRYVALIMEQLRKGPDCVGFTLKMEGNPRGPYPTWLSKDNEDDTFSDGWQYYPISHLNPARASLVKTISFTPWNDGWTDADGEFHHALRKLCQTEACVDRNEVMYHYLGRGGLSNHGRPEAAPAVTSNPELPFVEYL